MSATMQTRLQPPANDPPVTADGQQHSDAWAGFHQNVADRLDTLQAQMGKGVTDGSEAAAGKVGEYLTAVSGSVGLTSASVTNIISLDLTAGDWDVQGNVTFAAGSGTHTFFGAGVSIIDTFTSSTFPSAALNQAITTATHRFNVTATTTVWVVAQAGFTGTVTATGSVRARRMR
jgi:hypothetical protein